jgi:hypothetical protein
MSEPVSMRQLIKLVETAHNQDRLDRLRAALVEARQWIADEESICKRSDTEQLLADLDAAIALCGPVE